MEYLEDPQRNDVDEKVQLLLKNSRDLNSFLSTRIPIIELYLRFHQEAEHLTNLFNNLEQTLKTQKRQEDFHYIDTVWSKIQSQFSLLKNIAKLFSAEQVKVCCTTFKRLWHVLTARWDEFRFNVFEISEVRLRRFHLSTVGLSLRFWGFGSANRHRLLVFSAGLIFKMINALEALHKVGVV